MSAPARDPAGDEATALVGPRRTRPVIQLSALIDVLFIVLVFVVLAARFDQPRSLEVALPHARAGAPQPADQAAVLVVPRAGPMRLDGTPVAEDQLPRALRQVQARKPTLRLVADGGIPLDRATRLLDAATEAGFAAVSIATRAPAPEETATGETRSNRTGEAP